MSQNRRKKTEQRIREWYQLSVSGQIPAEQDSFFQFVAAWVAFNALYSDRMREFSGDREQVRQFAMEPDMVKAHSELLHESSEYVDALLAIQRVPIADTSEPGRRSKIEDIENLGEVAKSLYQIRCNLFHGGKSPVQIRDISLVKAGFTVVSKLLKKLLPS